MKNIILFLTFALLTVSCAQKEVVVEQPQEQTLAQEKPPLSQDDQNIRGVLLSVNAKIRGEYSKANKRNFTKFNEETYVAYLNKHNNERYKAMKKHLPEFENRDIKGFAETYVFCGYSTQHQLAFCDDANCVGVEFFDKANSPAILDFWKQQLPKMNCEDKVERN
ncbi:hypothetical protein ACLVWU_08505 [Bdellovibrio sp. HCB290]|uniref:hypothetical protein n=1 Tax=Bdellovibrio sp. HCB290 TaxID=3394356 RepID=UPI0039B638E2